jgi:hypothetical protein
MRAALLLLLFAVLALAKHPFAGYEHSRKVLLHSGHVDTTTTAPAFHLDERHARSAEENNAMTRYQYLVHLQGPIYSETKNRIERHLGHKLGQYLPHNTFLLYATSEVAKRAADLPEVLWVGPYLPENKISADVSSGTNTIHYFLFSPPGNCCSNRSRSAIS